jgi:hypothetical protein
VSDGQGGNKPLIPDIVGLTALIDAELKADGVKPSVARTIVG